MNRSEITTIRIRRKELLKLNSVCDVLNIGHIEFFEQLFCHVELGKKAEFYAKFPMPSNYIKPLQFKKIIKKYIKK